MMTIAEQIYTLVKTLPQEQAYEILTFVGSMMNRRENGVPLSEKHIETGERQVPWAEFIQALAGAWADDFPDLETICAGIGQDILRESL
jgi:hypothetical protein